MGLLSSTVTIKFGKMGGLQIIRKYQQDTVQNFGTAVMIIRTNTKLQFGIHLTFDNWYEISV